MFDLSPNSSYPPINVHTVVGTTCIGRWHKLWGEILKKHPEVRNLIEERLQQGTLVPARTHAGNGGHDQNEVAAPPKCSRGACNSFGCLVIVDPGQAEWKGMKKRKFKRGGIVSDCFNCILSGVRCPLRCPDSDSEPSPVIAGHAMAIGSPHITGTDSLADALATHAVIVNEANSLLSASTNNEGAYEVLYHIAGDVRKHIGVLDSDSEWGNVRLLVHLENCLGAIEKKAGAGEHILWRAVSVMERVVVGLRWALKDSGCPCLPQPSF